MGSKRKRHKRAVEREVQEELWLWSSWEYTDRISKRTGQPVRRFWYGFNGKKHYRGADHRKVPLTD